ncbi:M48 family metallopeptidase [Aequorivita sinensis]|uniref:M48 family metallopeptidase n=1 Tax=Aequorivita sinensis TaxID=1382458 RepID=UPI00112344F1|nr:SprT family zinc-dependent metalloprotease [Aequorivita sinensis]
MPEIKYGNKTIEYTILEKEGLRSHYITVEKGTGVTLKGEAIPIEKSDKLIAKKAKWIIDKLELVKSIGEDKIVTGSRIQYLGRKYYVEIFINEDIENIEINFTESKFKVLTPKRLNSQSNLIEAFETFFTQKAEEKIKPRLKKWSKKTGLNYKKVQFKQLEKQWGNCTPNNSITINIESIKLPYSLIDYLLVHELVHTKIKNHSKEFWAELSKHIPNWRELNDRMYGMRL